MSKIFTLISSVFALCLSNASHGQSTVLAERKLVEQPRGGWNYSGLIDHQEDTQVAYPTPPIDRGSQRHRTMIQGRIKQAGKSRIPMLVVNGNPMILNTDENGDYRRHYTFGSGSNSIEVKGADNSNQRIQFYETNPNQLLPQLRIICSWDSPETEVDMHILTPDGQHASFAGPVLNGGGGLDVDSVDGPGPEMFTTTSSMHGAYHIYVNYWGNLSPAGYNFDESQRQKPIITAQITLIFYENTPKEKRETFTVPLRKIGDIQLVKSFMF